MGGGSCRGATGPEGDPWHVKEMGVEGQDRMKKQRHSKTESDRYIDRHTQALARGHPCVHARTRARALGSQVLLRVPPGTRGHVWSCPDLVAAGPEFPVVPEVRPES